MGCGDGQDPKLHEVKRVHEAPDGNEEAWYDGVRSMLEEAYLGADDPFGQSGFRGDAARWGRARRPIVVAIHRDGTFLDIGCANGALMESIVAWAREDGHAVEPYGLDISPKLADLARRRLPEWRDRIHVGNALDWRPPFRFDYARTELVYVPTHRQRQLVKRLLSDVLAPGGRLIICSYGSSRRPTPSAEPVGDLLRSWGYEVAGEAAGRDSNGVVFTRVAWIEAPQLAPKSSA